MENIRSELILQWSDKRKEAAILENEIGDSRNTEFKMFLLF